jgi:hypothetical protein
MVGIIANDQSNPVDEIKRLMQTDLCGELTT